MDDPGGVRVLQRFRDGQEAGRGQLGGSKGWASAKVRNVIRG